MAVRPNTPRIRTLEEAKAYLEGLINIEKETNVSYRRFGLEPIRRLTARLGDPQRGLSLIHVAGSKGKGSTALFAEGMLRATGERVGTFTSPHLESWTERFRIEGREIDGSRLADVVRRIAPHVDALRAEDPNTGPTFFDATTAVALVLFREAQVDRAILEVGLGGRLDSTNVVTPAVSCITSIELEHTEQLGNTLAAIATEKAGILKPKIPAVIGALGSEATEVVESRARAIGTPLTTLGRDFSVSVLDENLDGTLLQITDGPIQIEARIAVLGPHQAENAALALACVRRTGRADCDDAIQSTAAAGLMSVRLPGRIELLRCTPWYLIDSAHTAVSAAALADVLKRIPSRRAHLVLSISAGKDLESILRSLLTHVSAVTVTRAQAARSLAPAEVAAVIRQAAPDLPLDVVPNPHLAIRAASEKLTSEDLLCVAGSVYLAGIARAVLGRGHPRQPLEPAAEDNTPGPARHTQ